LNDWSTGWALVAIALLIRVAISKDPWWVRGLGAVFAILPLVSQSLALMLRERVGDTPAERPWFLFLWEQAPYTGALFLLGWAIFTRDPKAARIASAVVAIIGLLPIVAILLIVLLMKLGAPFEMH
jgi:hypothetical protein